MVRSHLKEKKLRCVARLTQEISLIHVQNDEIEDRLSTPDDVTDEEEEHIVVTRPEEERDPEAEAEFDREFAKMMAESMDERRSEKRAMQDISMPTRRSQQDILVDDEEHRELPTTTTKFALLSKKGNKAQVWQVGEPSTSCVLTEAIDTKHRPPLRLELRCRDAQPTRSRTSRAAAD